MLNQWCSICCWHTTVSWIVIWGFTSKPKTYTNNYLESNAIKLEPKTHEQRVSEPTRIYKEIQNEYEHQMVS